MYQIDNASAAASQPASSAPGTAGFFTDGNPATNIPATIFPAEFANAMMMEIINAITGSGQTLNKSAFNQLLKAIQSSAGNIGVTPPQFDNTTKTPTTAWVNNRGVAYSSQVVVSSATTLTAAAHAGHEITITAAIPATLPLANTCPSGTVIKFISNIAGATVVRQGSDLIGMGTLGSITSVTVNQGDSLELMSDGSSSWIGTGGSAKLAGSSVFFSQRAASGYQKLPGGLIFQWATATTPASGTLTVFYPLVFPTTCICILVTNLTNAPPASFGGANFLSTSAFNLLTASSAGVGVSGGYQYFAIGY